MPWSRQWMMNTLLQLQWSRWSREIILVLHRFSGRTKITPRYSAFFLFFPIRIANERRTALYRSVKLPIREIKLTWWVTLCHRQPEVLTNSPRRLAPWSRAAPVSDCTRCNSDSRDLAGDDGAEVPREPPRRLRDRSPPPEVEADVVADGTGGGPEALLTLVMLPPVAGYTLVKVTYI